MIWYQMEYFDTNVYVYAFCKNVDDENQKELSVNLIREALRNDAIVLSEMILYEFAFVSYRLKEEKAVIEKNLNFIAQFIKPTSPNIYKRVMDIWKKGKYYSSSFDIFHLAFCEENDCKLITFDKGFKKLQKHTGVQIEILDSSHIS